MAKSRIITKLLSNNCKSTLKTIIKSNDTLLANYDKQGTESKIKSKSDAILQYYYYLIENTDFKDSIIEQHNQDYVKDRQLSNVMLSVKSTPNNIKSITPEDGKKGITYKQVLDNSTSKDLVTKDFRDNEFAMDDELFQKISSWSNRFAHRCDDEIKSISGSINFDVHETQDTSKKHNIVAREKKNFSTKLFKAYKDFKTDVNYACDIKEILKNVTDDKYAKDLSTEKDVNVQKMLALIKKYYPDQIVDKEFLQKYVYCLDLEDTCMDFFEIKNIAIKELLIYQDRKKEQNKEQGEDLYEDQNIITFVVPDTAKTKDNKATCRVVSLTKSEYDRYIKYNDSYSFSPKHIKMYADKYNISEYEAERYMEESVKGDRLSSTERKALMAKCAVNSYHIPLDELETFIQERDIKNINREYPPLIECFAYSGSALYDITPSKEKEKVLENVLSKQEKICQRNSEKYKKYTEPEQKFCKDNSIEAHVIEKTNERRK